MGNCSWSTLCRKCGFITVEFLEATQQRRDRIRANVSKVKPNFGSGKFRVWRNISRVCEMLAESGGICTLCLRLCAGCVYWFFNCFMFQLFAAHGNGFVSFELRFWRLCQWYTHLYLNNTQPVKPHLRENTGHDLILQAAFNICKVALLSLFTLQIGTRPSWTLKLSQPTVGWRGSHSTCCCSSTHIRSALEKSRVYFQRLLLKSVHRETVNS